MKDRHVLQNGYLSATIKADGAELCSLRDAEDEELLWQAAPVWPRHAPVLFPIVGRLKGDVLRHRGQHYPMTQHGFARDRRFAWLQRTATTCRLALHDDGETRAHYPFAFRASRSPTRSPTMRSRSPIRSATPGARRCPPRPGRTPRSPGR